MDKAKRTDKLNKYGMNHKKERRHKRGVRKGMWRKKEQAECDQRMLKTGKKRERTE